MKDPNYNFLSTDDLPMGIGNPARRALEAAGIRNLSQLTQFSEAELLKLHGVGPKAIRIIKERLAAQGLGFAAPNKTITVSEAAHQKIERRAPKTKG